MQGDNNSWNNTIKPQNNQKTTPTAEGMVGEGEAREAQAPQKRYEWCSREAGDGKGVGI